MEVFLLILAVVTLAGYLVTGLETTLGSARMHDLDRIEPLSSGFPKVSVVVPARDEELHIEAALSSVLAQDYPELEVIAVDDRSGDSTGAILDRMSERSPRLRVVHIRELPPHWLGKNNALHQGAAIATGSLILFTDADIVMHPSVLRRAVAYMEREKLDHLAIPPKAVVPGFLATAFLGMFALLFSLYTKPWKLRDPKHRAHIGIGAFNLVRASVYRSLGGHSSIALRVDDDMRLGKLIKSRGFVQDLVFGVNLMKVEWYPSFSAMQRGLTKNFFAAVNFNIAAVSGGVTAQLLFFVWPWIALFATRGPVRILNALIVLSLCVSFALNARRLGMSWYWCLSMPIAALVSIYLLLRSTVLNLWSNGIEWRGTRYSLAELRKAATES